ncbi:beta-N-acetylhexosaminidase [Rubritalea tangerina]|uniref:beta-N-acetylhexosaminidase n=1 Tax=Rubritalea tangerina TaxID=430798 RepID=A0ABW4ZBE8_9BACT
MHGQLLLLGIKGYELSSNEIHYLSKIQPGGFVLFGRNIHSPEQVRALTDSLRDLCDIPPIIAIDQEGGRVTRTKEIGNTPPSAEQLAQSGKPDLIAWHGILTGLVLTQLGINMNLAPVLDISYMPDADNALRGRCYGRDAQEVINNAGVYNRNLIRTKVHGCGKHFPSCGLADVDPHHKLPTSNKTKEEMLQSDLLPYTALGSELSAILTCHTHFSELDPDTPGLPASLSRNVVTRLLRDQLGYKGVVMTDDLDMGAIINTYGRGPDVKMAIEAGNDMAMICHQTDTAEQALASLQELSPYAIDDSLKRIRKLKKKLAKTIAFSRDRWDKLNDEIMELRIETLGEEAARDQHDSIANSRSPVEDY